MPESSGLPPEQEAVRRLLADARHDGPPPADVVARLDDTLASLVAERAAGPAERAADAEDRSPGRVVDLGSRRRRVASIGLLAAASVVVAGVAIGQALPRGGGEDSSAGSAADSSLAESPEAGDSSADSSTSSGADEGAGAASEPAPESLKSSPATPFAGVPSLSTADAALEDQVLALRGEATDRRQQLASLDALRGCDVPRQRRAVALVAAQVDGQAGVVVFRRPAGQAQGVELYVCGQAEPVRTITLPAP